MIDDVKAAFKQRLGDAEWMDAGTKKAALVKLDAITDMIGYPDYIKVCTGRVQIPFFARLEKFHKFRIIIITVRVQGR